MTNAKKFLAGQATHIIDQQIEENAVQADENLLSKLEQFETNAPLVETIVFGGLAAKNALTASLQEFLFINADGIFGKETADELLRQMDENDLALKDYPELSKFLKENHAELVTDFQKDQRQEKSTARTERKDDIKGLQERLAETFGNTKTAILDEYFNKDELRPEIEKLIEKGVSREEISTTMMKKYNEIIENVDDSIQKQIKEALELDSVGVDDFAKEQISEVFGQIDTEAAAAEAEKQIGIQEYVEKNTPIGT